MAVGAAQIPASRARPPQGGMVFERSPRAVRGRATADERRVKPEHEGTEPTNGGGASRRRGNVEMAKAVLTESPERVRRKPNSLGASRVWRAARDHSLFVSSTEWGRPARPHLLGSCLQAARSAPAFGLRPVLAPPPHFVRERRRRVLAKACGPSRKATSGSGGHSGDPALPSHLSPGRETVPETSDPKGSARSPQGRRERPTGYPPKGAASAPQGTIGTGLRVGTGWEDTSPNGFGRMVRSERSQGRSYRRFLPLGVAIVGPGTSRGGASFLGVSRVQGSEGRFG